MSTEEDDLRAQFGKPRDGNGVNIITIEKDSFKIVRLLPPMKSVKDTGFGGAYHKQHFGYSVRDPRDATKTRMRPFLCVEETDDQKLVTVSCPECRKREEVAQKIKDTMAIETAKHLAAGLNPKEAEARAAETAKDNVEWLDAHNLDKKWFIPVMLEDGSFGFLKVPHSARKAIDKAKKTLKAEEDGRGLDGLDDGVWLKITRVGTGRETDYDAAVVKEPVTVEGRRLMATKPAALSPENLRSALALPDVTSSSIIRRLTKDQIRILAEGGGSPEEVEAVLNLAQRADPRPAPAPAPVQVQSRPTPAAVAATPTSAPAAAKPAPAPAPEDDEEAAAERALAAVRAKKAAKTAAAQVKAQVASPQALDPDISDDEFASRFPPPAK